MFSVSLSVLSSPYHLLQLEMKEIVLTLVMFDPQGKIRAVKPPEEADFQTIKLISNGAYG